MEFFKIMDIQKDQFNGPFSFEELVMGSVKKMYSKVNDRISNFDAWCLL